jgi:predicted Fe-Mo cluster-binding NifX family protein
VKIAFSTSGDDLGAPLDARFGRAPKFLIYDLDTDTFTVIDNRKTMDSAQGAGIQSAQTVARSGAGAVVTGNCGPKAFRVLSAAGVRIYTAGASTIREALDLYRAGGLTEADAANVEGHWS